MIPLAEELSEEPKTGQIFDKLKSDLLKAGLAFLEHTVVPYNSKQGFRARRLSLGYVLLGNIAPLSSRRRSLMEKG